MSRPADDDALARAAARHRRRTTRAAAESGSVLRSLATIGALGWLIVAPALLALYAGRQLDAARGGGIFWTAGLLVAGFAAGCALAWRHVARHVEADAPDDAATPDSGEDGR